jgi:3-deoxy-manno-octulosonate cytidylyltransferase (CMP-KDO synthetase)
MGVCAIIPARYASTRLPGKPLLAETGKPLIQHVVEAVRPAQRVDRVVVATDDRRILESVEGFGGEAVLTREDHVSGTDRLAEAAQILGLAPLDIVVNVQGDEPDVPASCVDALVELLDGSEAPMATLATPLATNQATDPNRVKVVLRDDGRALYFSRAAIPHDRDASGKAEHLLHLGLYAYRREFLERFAAMPPAALEETEKLEQLRVLAAGCDIAVGVVSYDGHGIDTPEDYTAFVARTKALKKQGRTDR